MDQYKSLNLATLWHGLERIRAELINDLQPIATHLNIEDPKLMVKMDGFIKAIDEHFEKFHLQAVRKTIGTEVKK